MRIGVEGIGMAIAGFEMGRACGFVVEGGRERVWRLGPCLDRVRSP